MDRHKPALGKSAGHGYTAVVHPIPFKDRSRWLVVAIFAAVIVAAFVIAAGRAHDVASRAAGAAMTLVRGRRTVADRLAEYGDPVRARLAPAFVAARVAYPPTSLVLAGFKLEKRLDMYAAGPAQPLRFVKSYWVRALSGRPGPKLRAGDRQVPEGVYGVDSLNPNSLFHLSLHLAYPSEFDRRMAQLDGRDDLGGDIMIHGGASSVGCLAVGDEAAEELFVLVALVGSANTTTILSPVDFRVRELPPGIVLPPWARELYGHLSRAVRQLPTGTM